MITIEECMVAIKNNIEQSITTASFSGKVYDNGHKAKEALIRSQKLINYLHELVKSNFVRLSIDPTQIYPPPNKTRPELKLAGFLKQKNQDVCIKPKNINPCIRKIDWGPLAHGHCFDKLGEDLTEKTLVVNIRSQLSSIAKNTDTLFERTFAETLNLHIMYKNIVMGEVYLIPVYEYKNLAMENNDIAFKEKSIDIEKYISFFIALNNRLLHSDDIYKYERCALIIVDFSKNPPVVYSTTQQLKSAGLVQDNFNLELANISFDRFGEDILDKYIERFGRNGIFV